MDSLAAYTHTNITTALQEKPLQLGTTTLDWEEHPVIMSGAELSALKVERVMGAIAKGAKTPSQLAGIPEEKRCDFIKIADGLYMEVVKVYLEELRDAEKSDHSSANKCKEKVRYTAEKTGALAGSVVVIVGAFGVKTGVLVLSGIFGGPVGVVVVAGLLAGGVAYGVEDKNRRFQVLREGSANRRKWLYEVAFREEERIQRLRENVEAELDVLEDEIREITEADEVDWGRDEEREQLKKLLKVLGGEDGRKLLAD